MRLKGMYKYVLLNAVEEVIGVFDELSDLHRWINETYPNTGGTNSRGRELVINKVLPSMFRIAKIRSEDYVL